MAASEFKVPTSGSDSLPQPDGFGKPEHNSTPASRLGPGSVRRPDPQPEVKAPGPNDDKRKRHRPFGRPLSGPERELAREAERQARQLRRDHRAVFNRDPRRFRKIVRVAQSTVFRQKPGPKPDRQAARRISRAARKYAQGAKWPDLYERFLPGWKDLNPVTRGNAEDGFRRKVNRFLQSHRRLRKAK